MPLLSVNNIAKQFADGTVLQAHFQLRQGDKLAIAGETGSGKTTLMKIIAGLEQPDSGEIFFDNEKVWGPNFQLIAGHKGIAYLSQYFELRNHYRVHELLDYANKMEATAAQAIFNWCRIDHLLQRKSNELSGGERQRIALARLLIGQPKLLVLDEPFSNLDRMHKLLIKEVLSEVTNQLNLTCIMVAHEPADILPWANQIMLLRNGKVVQQGTPKQLYNQPEDVYCAGLLGEYNLLKDKSGQQFIIRPEDLSVSTNTLPGSYACVVHQVLFLGDAYLLKLRLENGAMVKAKTLNSSFQTGDALFISF
jgi:ABC-type sugar transport system ATPase subunit